MVDATPASALSPQEACLLRILCTVAWSDGECSEAERRLLLEQVRRYFQSEASSLDSEAELAGFLAEKLQPGCLTELVPRLSSEEDRELALKLSYMIIRVGRRSPEETSINAQERVAYRTLVDLLGIDDGRIREIEWAAESELPRRSGLAELLAQVASGWAGEKP
jgi:hypothetical protein